MLAVVGAGPTGLAIAWRLSRAGHEVVVLEEASRVGGMAASLTVSGQRVDLGCHRLDPRMPARVRAAIEELVDLQQRPRRDRIRIQDRWIDLPATSVSLLRAGLLPAARRAAERAWTTKLLGVSADDLESRPRPRADGDVDGDGDGPRGLVTRARRVVDPRGSYLYPRRGFGALCEAMAEHVPDVRLGTRVTGLIEHDDRVIVGLGDGRIITASHVFSTVSVGRTAAWLGLADPASVRLPARALVLVYLTVRGRPYTSYGAHLLPASGVLPTRVSEPANHRAGTSDPPDRTVLCAEIPCDVDDRTWEADASELGLRVADDLVRVGLPDPAAEAVELARLPSAYPVQTTHAAVALRRAEKAMRGSTRVTALGRHGSHAPLDVHDAMSVAFDAAALVRADGTFDGPWWERARGRAVPHARGLAPR